MLCQQESEVKLASLEKETSKQTKQITALQSDLAKLTDKYQKLQESKEEILADLDATVDDVNEQAIKLGKLQEENEQLQNKLAEAKEVKKL